MKGAGIELKGGVRAHGDTETYTPKMGHPETERLRDRQGVAGRNFRCKGEPTAGGPKPALTSTLKL